MLCPAPAIKPHLHIDVQGQGSCVGNQKTILDPLKLRDNLIKIIYQGKHVLPLEFYNVPIVDG